MFACAYTALQNFLTGLACAWTAGRSFEEAYKDENTMRFMPRSLGRFYRGLPHFLDSKAYEAHLDRLAQRVASLSARSKYVPGIGIVERDPYDRNFSGFFQTTG